MKPTYNDSSMRIYSHPCDGFDHVLHIAHREWHGIRQATAACPGSKLLISADDPLTEEDLDYIADLISGHDYKIIVFQGFSPNADHLLVQLKARLLNDISCYVITHVNATQFENYFEMAQLAIINKRLLMGTLDGLGSVKPDFKSVVGQCWEKTIFNFPPNFPASLRNLKYTDGLVHVPLDASWRKNLHTNIISALNSGNVKEVRTSNFPFGLESVLPLGKLRVTGYLRGESLYSQMADANIVLCATLAECQPMTQLESLAVGTPCLTGPLGLIELADDPLTQLCEVNVLDNPRLVANNIDNVIQFRNDDPGAMLRLIEARLSKLASLAESRYREFLGI